MILQTILVLQIVSTFINAFIPRIHKKSTLSTHTNPIHTRTKINLNRILFEWDEITSYTKDENNTMLPVVQLNLDDYRCKHICNILKLNNGDTIRAGIVNECVEGADSSHDTKNYGMIYNNAKIHWNKKNDKDGCEQKESLKITLCDGIKQAKSTSNISIILALPRPLQLGRILPMITQLGVDSIILTSAKKVPADYFGSHLLRTPKEMRALLLEGLSQAGNDVIVPKIHIFRYLNTFLKYHLDDMFPLQDCARVIAHPYDERMMRDIVFPVQDCGKGMVIAVGPEGGWIDEIEVPKFVDEYSFQPVSLGDRILRTDVAVMSLLALAHDVCND